MITSLRPRRTGKFTRVGFGSSHLRFVRSFTSHYSGDCNQQCIPAVTVCIPSEKYANRQCHHRFTRRVDSHHLQHSNYNDYVNPQWVSLLNLLGMNVEYERCLGCEFFTKDARRVLDFLSSYCVHNAGHNHPYIIQALKDEMDRGGPAIMQSNVPEIAGDLARRLCELAGGELEKVCFGSRCSEGVEAAI